MLQNLSDSWKNNRGNLLLSLGAVTGVLMCVVWYYDLVPEVALAQRGLAAQSIRTSRTDQSVLVAIVQTPPLKQPPVATGENEALPPVRVIVEMLSPQGFLHATEATSFRRTIDLAPLGGKQAVILSDIPPGSYAVLAFIDLNDNGKLDFDAENINATEPYRLSKLPRKHTVPIDLEATAIEINAQQTALVEFNFAT